MRTTLTLLTLFLTVAAAAADERPRAFHTSVQDGGYQASVALGRAGAWLISSAERWDETRKSLDAAGVKVTDDALGPVDWLKENVVCVFNYGDPGDQFSLRKVAGDDKARDVEFAMSYVIAKSQRQLPMAVWRAFAVPVPKSAATAASVSTFHPQNGGPHPTIDKAQLEWAYTFSDKAGDAVGGLTGSIEAKAATVKPGDDIAVQFTLRAADAAKVEGGRFVDATDVVRVWDGKYSMGYRNHSFAVVTPDGKLVILRPAEIKAWDKNAPHPVEIKPDGPYILPDWANEKPFKSLKQLGLDTTAPGVYTITGVYHQHAERGRDGNVEMWNGTVRTNTVRVEVK